MCQILSRVKSEALSETLKWTLSQVLRLSTEPCVKCDYTFAADCEIE